MEEIPRKQEDANNKNSKKTLPVALNIRAGGLGIGGIVLVGGALVAASIVAFKTRRSSSKNNIKKKTSQSPETRASDAPSSDDAISMKEIQTKNNSQRLTPDKKHEMDSEDIIDPVVVQDFAVECTEEDSCLDRDDGDGEEKKHLMLIDKENDEQVDANSSVSDEVVMSVEEYEVIEDGEDHQETAMEDGCVHDQVKVEDNLHDEIVLDNCEGDLSDHETGYIDQIVHEVVTEEEARRLMSKEEEDQETAQKVEEVVIEEDEATKIDQSKDEIQHVEFVKEEQENEKVVRVKVELSSGVVSFSMQKKLTPEENINNNNSEEAVLQDKVEMIDETPPVESVIDDKNGEEDVTIKAKLGSGVSSSSMQEEVTPEANITNHKIEETVLKDEIPHVEFVKEYEEDVEDVTKKAELGSDELTPEAKISNNIVETNTQVKLEMIIDHELVKEDGAPYVEYRENVDGEKDVAVNVDLGSGVGFSSTLEEPTQEAKISNHKTQENMKEDQANLGENKNENHDHGVIKEKVFASEPWNPKLMALFVLLSVCCLVGSLLFILILLAYRNRATNLVKLRAEN